KKPFYYYQKGGRLYFASEMKALFLIPHLTRSLNPQAAVEFCTERLLNHTEETFVTDIRQLPAATSMLWKDGGVKAERYWNFAAEDTIGEGRNETDLEEIAFLMEDAVRLRLRADTPIGCLASGGLD